MISFWRGPPLAAFPTVKSGLKSTVRNALLQAQFQTLLNKGAKDILEEAVSGFSLLALPCPKNQISNGGLSFTSAL